jgi:hypothetical protein
LEGPGIYVPASDSLAEVRASFLRAAGWMKVAPVVKTNFWLQLRFRIGGSGFVSTAIV